MDSQMNPHFVLIPFMAQGHMIPMVDIARMLARQGVVVTILTTPVNAKRSDSVLAQAVNSGLPIHVIQIHFPSAESGLPEGCECFDMLPSVDSSLKFFAACKMLQPSVEEKLEELKPSPSCILADFTHPWANQVAEKFEYFPVPDLPHRIELTKAQTASLDRPLVPQWKNLHQEIEEAENGALGFVLNTFEELEPDYIAQFRKAKGKKVWCIGPVSLCNKNNTEIVERGNKAAVNSDLCLKWLDSWEENSVIYACLGSINRPSTSQLIELGTGLQESNRPFICVIKDPSIGVQVTRNDTKMAVEKLMDGGDEGRMRRRRAQELGKIARKALDEGNSSYLNVTQLIQDITDTMIVD
ncbi:OLC1v1006121C1 [Oldenlandia corymbosa var. corymbosa]|uniref:OLC1v1006121C1 n=1 Tax=Oldenlandia corymbosa var. corymbosa TaxID=529605 RepID=A0AAV1DIC3_OLDCO|nr:OLC1v1006121C1 [Oldenlandia corymbosa var. corymbosa]